MMVALLQKNVYKQSKARFKLRYGLKYLIVNNIYVLNWLYLEKNLALKKG